MKIFSHNDADGRSAAAIVYNYYEGRATIIESDYKDIFNFDDVKPDEPVIIVDFSFKPPQMKLLMEKTTDLVWCDHHKTAKDYNYDLKGLRDFEEPGRSGAYLTWLYYYPKTTVPESVKLISDRDTWAWKYGEDTRNFNEGLKLVEGATDPTSPVWLEILSDKSLEEIKRLGQYAVAYRNYFCKTYLQYSYETYFEGYNCIVLNLHTMGSESFLGKLKDYDLGLCYVHTGTGYIVNLYTVKPGLDVSAIAVKYGGGGHSQAAGFNCYSLPWIKKL